MPSKLEELNYQLKHVYLINNCYKTLIINNKRQNKTVVATEN
jgi:hypothetical protein